MKYYIELQEKINNKYPKYISLNQYYNSIEEAKSAIVKMKEDPEMAGYNMLIRAHTAPTPIEKYL